MHKNRKIIDEIDTKEEIELEKEKWSLAKYKADTIIDIVRDAILLLIMIISTIINFIAGKTSTEQFASLSDVAAGSGVGYGSGPGLDTVSAAMIPAEPAQLLESIFNIHTGLGTITIAALVFFVLPRIKKMFTKDKK